MNTLQPKSIKNQKGVLLPLALVMTTVLLTAALILATLAIRESRVAALSDKAQVASYVTESIAEEAMYEIVKNSADPSTLPGSGSFSSGATWTRTVTEVSDQFIYDFFPAGGAERLDLYNNANAGASAGVTSLNISWSSGTEISVLSEVWDGTALTAGASRTLTCPAGRNCSGSITLDPTKAYKLIISASDSVLTDVFIQTQPAGTEVETPTTVTVVGEFKGAKQATQLLVPKAAPWEIMSTEPPPPVSATCGNGTAEFGEQCDDANGNPNDACTNACLNNICGDGFFYGGVEECDDGNTLSLDGCSSNCVSEGAVGVCGNGVLEAGEFCDEFGDTTNAGNCNSTCTGLTFCGDGTVQSSNGSGGAETCDDGNQSTNDGCTPSCVLESCVVRDYVGVTALEDFSAFTRDIAVERGFTNPNNGVAYSNFNVLSHAVPVCTSNCAGISWVSPPRYSYNSFIGFSIYLGKYAPGGFPPAVHLSQGSIQFCDPAATTSFCGNGIEDDVREECDDGNDNEFDSCTSTCKDQSCSEEISFVGQVLPEEQLFGPDPFTVTDDSWRWRYQIPGSSSQPNLAVTENFRASCSPSPTTNWPSAACEGFITGEDISSTAQPGSFIKGLSLLSLGRQPTLASMPAQLINNAAPNREVVIITGKIRYCSARP